MRHAAVASRESIVIIIVIWTRGGLKGSSKKTARDGKAAMSVFEGLKDDEDVHSYLLLLILYMQ